MREIVKDTVRLRALAAAGVGVVHNLFDKRMHDAGCPTVRERMRASSDNPASFFPTHAEAVEFLARHVERCPTAKWQLACCCADRFVASSRSAPRQPHVSPSHAPHGRIEPIPVVEVRDRSIAAWSDHDIRNQTAADSPGGRLRSRLSSWLRASRPRPGELLEAAYAGERRNGADVENLLFKNIDQTATAYRAACAEGLRFSWLGPIAPPGPSGTARRYHYRYRFVPLAAPTPSVVLRPWARRWTQVPLLEGFPGRAGVRMSSRVWWSLRQRQAERRDGLDAGATFAARLVLHGEGVDPAMALKGSFDGVVAALEVQENESAAVEAAAILAGAQPENVSAIARKLTEHEDPVLGSVDRLVVPVAARHGPDVRWDPADSGCIAGEILVGERHGPPRLDVELYPCELAHGPAA
jgi:hypothetical protein